MWQGYMYYLFSALNKLPLLDLIVYRGVKTTNDMIAKEYTIGRKIHWSAFSSTTTDLKVAKSFAGYAKIIFQIGIQTGRNIQPFSVIKMENEILLSPNMTFIVTKTLEQKEDGYYYLHLLQLAGLETFVF